MADPVPPGTARTAGAGQVNNVEAQDLFNAAGIGGTGMGYNNAGPGWVSLGSAYETSVDIPTRAGTYTARSSAIVPITGAYGHFNRMSVEELRAFGKQASRYLNYDASKAPGTTLQSIWNDGVNGLAMYQQETGDTSMGVIEYLRLQNDRREAAGLLRGSDSGTGGGAYTGPVTSISTNRIINLTDPTEAQSFVDSALQQYLGRNATEEERSKFYQALNQLERENPVIQRSRQTTTPYGPGLQKSKGRTVQEGGINAAVVAEEFAASRPQAAETAISGQYMDWFMEKLGQDTMRGLEVGSA